MAYRAEVIADNSGKWVANGVVFATRDEAVLYADDLALRWTLVRDTRVVETDAPVTDQISNGHRTTVG